MTDLLKFYDEETDRLLEQEQSLKEQLGDENKTRILMRVVAARLQHEANVPHQVALEYNTLLTRAMRVGYLMGRGEQPAVQQTGQRFFVSSRIIYA